MKNMQIKICILLSLMIALTLGCQNESDCPLILNVPQMCINSQCVPRTGCKSDDDCVDGKKCLKILYPAACVSPQMYSLCINDGMDNLLF